MSWSNEAVIQFLELYKREQVIWDPKHIYHKSRSEVSNAWHRIQADFDVHCSIVDLKKKKESLMTTFRLHHNKKKADARHKIVWFAYDLMASFLSEKYDSGCVDNEITGGSSQVTFKPDKRSIFENKNNFKIISSDLKLGQSKYKRENMDCVSTTEANDNLTISDDEYELYGQLLAKKLRKLDERQRDIAMHEIDNIMFRAKMQSGCTQSNEYSSLSPTASRKPKSPLFVVTSLNQPQHYEAENMQQIEVYTHSKINS